MKNGPYEMVIAPKDYPGKKYRDRYCYEHTLVWWKNTGTIPKDNEIIHHKNGNKRDNPFSNLELRKKGGHVNYHNVNRSDETRHKIAESQKGSKNNASKLTESQVRIIKIRFNNGDRLNTIAKDFNISRVTISSIGSDKTWSHVKI